MKLISVSLSLYDVEADGHLSFSDKTAYTFMWDKDAMEALPNFLERLKANFMETDNMKLLHYDKNGNPLHG